MATNGPGVQKAAPQSSLKSIIISGTDLSWTVGNESWYYDKAGKKVVSDIIALTVVANPDQPGWEQVVIIFKDGYKDYFVTADHLIIRNLHVSELLVPVTKVELPK